MLFVIICFHIGFVVGVILLIIALKEKLEKQKSGRAGTEHTTTGGMDENS